MSELIRHFGIDWKLLLAQAVNFFILLVILKKFAYGPVLKMLKKRKEEIEKGLKFTKEAGEKLENIGKEREEIMKTARSEALKVVSEAADTARLRRDEAVGEAARKSEEIITAARKVIKEEKAKTGEEVYKEAGSLIKLGIVKVLGKMPAKERDEELIREALKELKQVL